MSKNEYYGYFSIIASENPDFGDYIEEVKDFLWKVADDKLSDKVFGRYAENWEIDRKMEKLFKKYEGQIYMAFEEAL